jgi:hypothetical protein
VSGEVWGRRPPGEAPSGEVWGGRPSGEAPSTGAWEGRPPGEAPDEEAAGGRSADPAADGVAPDALRAFVREVLRDVLPGLAGQPGSPRPAGPPARESAAPTARRAREPAAPTTRPAREPAAPPTSEPVSGPAAPPVPPTSDPGPPRLAGATGAGGPARAAGGCEAVSRPGLEVRPVRLATDEELHEFVLQVIALADNPKRRRDLLAGRLRFTLGPARAPQAPADHRIEKGAVTERAVQAAASAGARLVLGPRAVLTPLARDRARALGVPIEKER